MLELRSQDVELVLDPWLGGGIAAFRWRGINIFRAHNKGRSPIELASFPLAPFCNRIADGQITYKNKPLMLPPASKWGEPQHALHGIGWINPWATKHTTADSATLTLRHNGMQWPWAFEAQQRFHVIDNGYSQVISITNLDSAPMPAGLGLHPYFPRSGAVIKTGAKGFWTNSRERLPHRYSELKKEPDWFSGPGFDNCFTACSNPVHLHWPTHRLAIHSSPNLRFTHVYTPQGEDYFCVEPVSHIPNAVNSALDQQATGLTMLEPGRSMEIECRFELEEQG